VIRVMLVGPYPVDTTRFGGGVETSFHNLVQGLIELDDVDPHIFTLARGATSVRRDHDGAAPVTYLPAGARFNNLTMYRNDRRVLAGAFRELAPDVVHAQDAIGYGYASLKAIDAAPVVVSIHGIVSEELKHLRNPLDRLRTSFARVPVQKYCVRHARHLIQPSGYPEAYFNDQIRGSITEVGNAVSEIFFDGTSEPEHGRLLYVGGVSVGKRVLDLIDVLGLVRQSVPHAHLRIAGHLTDIAYVDEVRERIAARGLGDAISLLGACSPAQLADEYGRASVFVLASGQENSPMVIAEAMAAGVPVVATRTGGVDSLVEEGATGHLVEIGAVARFAGCVNRLLLDDQARGAFGVASRAVADARFRPVQVAARVRDVYREALRDSA
jgi:glycosyltransferase involved in cell wall biosynthesis